jgi:alpha-1,2-mannosyltransferase
MAFFLIALSLLAVVVLSFVLLPKSLRFAGELLGSNLRRASRTRRELLLARSANEQRTYEAEHKGRHEKEEDDWEEVEASAAGSAMNGGPTDKEWSGIVGFFHPFWYAWRTHLAV